MRSISSSRLICLSTLMSGILLAPLAAIAEDNPPVKDAAKELVTIVLQNQIDGFSDSKMAVTKACRIRYLEPKIPRSIKSQFGFDSICFDVNSEQKREAISARYGGAYSDSHKNWVTYYEGSDHE